MTPNLKAAFGGVVTDALGRVLLREPTNHYDGYVWTFPKGKANPGETAEQAALREVLEETGCRARVVQPVPGDFTGGTTLNHYFLMIEMVPGSALAAHDWETSQVRWATLAEAKNLIGMSTNSTGRKRDLAVLNAAFSLLQTISG